MKKIIKSIQIHSLIILIILASTHKIGLSANNELDISDIILALQIVSSGSGNLSLDIDGDNKTGLADVIYIFQRISKNDSSIFGKITTNCSCYNELQVRAYAYTQPGTWMNQPPIKTSPVLSSGVYFMNLPEGAYFFSVYFAKQNGPEFFYNIPYQKFCNRYELQLKDSESNTIVFTKRISCNPESISIEANNPAKNIDFDIPQTGHVSGKVTQSDGSDFSQVTVSAIFEGETIAQIQTNETGMYTLSGLPAGDYYFHAKSIQNEYQPQYFKNNDSKNVYYEADTAPIFIDSARTDIDFKLKKGATVTGKIISYDQMLPLKDVFICAYDSLQNRKTGQSVASDAQGNYTIYGLPSSDYFLYADAQMATPYVSSWVKSIYQDSNNVDKYKLKILDAVLYPDQNIDLKPPGRIIATIKDEEGEKIKDNQIYVNVYHASDHSLVKRVQFSQGEAIIENLYESYQYKFEIIADGTRYASVFYDNKTLLADAKAENVYNGLTRYIDFQLTEGGTITGRVVDGSIGRSDFTVRAISQSNPSRIIETLTNNNGEYTLKGLYEDNYWLQVLTDGSFCISEFYQGEYSQQNATTIGVKNGQTKSNRNFTLDKGSTIKGQVKCDDTSDLIAGIPVYAVNTIKGLTFASITDKNGRYQLTGIPNGNDYSILVDTTGSVYLPTLYSEDQSGILDRVSVVTVGQVIVANFTLKKRARLCGSITCPFGEVFDYCMENLVPNTYDLMLVDDENNVLKQYLRIGFQPNDIKTLHFNLQGCCNK